MAFNTLTINCTSDLGTNLIDFNYTQGAGTGTLVDFVIERSLDNITFSSIGVLNYVSDGAYSFGDDDLLVICDTLMYYRIQPRNDVSGDFELVSSSVSCTKNCGIVPSAPLSSPITNCASANSVSGIVVSWTPYAGSSSDIPYLSVNLYKSINGGSFSLLVSLSGTVTSYTDTTVLVGTQYSYYIQYSFDDYGTSSSISPISATCLLSDDCRQNGPVTSFPFTISTDSDCKMSISNLMNTNGTFPIPESLSCNDIGSIISMGLKVIKCNLDASSSSYTPLTTIHPNWNADTSSFDFSGYDEGVWKFILQVVYKNLNDDDITITTTRCAYLNCCHKCQIAKKALTSNTNLLDLFIFIDVIETAVTCNDCAIACDYYSHLSKEINKYDCNC